MTCPSPNLQYIVSAEEDFFSFQSKEVWIKQAPNGRENSDDVLTLLNKAVFLIACTSSGASGGSRYFSLFSSQFCLYKTYRETNHHTGYSGLEERLTLFNQKYPSRISFTAKCLPVPDVGAISSNMEISTFLLKNPVSCQCLYHMQCV